MLLFFHLLSCFEIGKGFVWNIINFYYSFISTIHSHVEVIGYSKNNKYIEQTLLIP
jgi:hypothetical protein